MDFVERIFHMSPDHGSGTFEAAILFAAVVIPVTLAVVRFIGRRANGRRVNDFLQKISLMAKP